MGVIIQAFNSSQNIQNSLIVTIPKNNKEKIDQVSKLNKFLQQQGLEVNLKINDIDDQNNNTIEKLILDYYNFEGERQPIINSNTPLTKGDLIKIEYTIESTKYRDLFQSL